MWPKPHCRTPGFVFGVAGQVERVAGVFSDPGISALGLVGEDGGDTQAPTQGIADSADLRQICNLFVVIYAQS